MFLPRYYIKRNSITRALHVRMIVLILLFTILATVLLKWTRHKQNYMKYVQHLPSPKEYPFIGSAYRVLGKDTKGKLQDFLKSAN